MIPNVDTPDLTPPFASVVPRKQQFPEWQADRPDVLWKKPVLTLFIALFAFLLASFPARSSDIWWHLASGRELAHGRLLSDPASLSANSQAGSTWLYDFACYVVYSLVSGPGLLIAKCLLLAVVGLFLLRLCRTGSGWWIAVACTVLALLAMGTRLPLQPVMVSYLLFAVMLLILRHQEVIPSGQPVSFLPSWPLAILFVLWVNVDSWFVVGLGIVGLVWLGRSLDERGGLLRRLVAFAGLALVCLFNPVHWHVFTLPVELKTTGTAIESAASGLGLVTSPFQRTYLTQFGQTPAGLAYYPLLGFGLLTFGLTIRLLRWQWFLPWLALAALSAYQARAVPFFAIVGGPVLAWNLQRIFATRVGTVSRDQQPGFRSLTSRLLPAGLGLALLVCAWPGWLQVPPFEPRNWAIETPPTLERSALAAHEWHRSGQLGPTSRALHLSPDTVRAFAWFCPEDHGILSARLASREGTPELWAQRMREEGITHAVVYDSNRERLYVALEQFLADPVQWPLLYLEGDLAIFGWRDPARPETVNTFRDWELDLNQLAFHPTAEKVARRDPPDLRPHARRMWEAFWKPAPTRPIDGDEAALHLLQSEVLRRSTLARHVTAWEATHVAALVGAAGNWSGPGSMLDAQIRLTLLHPPAAPQSSGATNLPLFTVLALTSYERFAYFRDDATTTSLYLAIRAARRALAENPEDAQSYLVLGESYFRLIQSPRERIWVRRMPELYQLRAAQASAALNQAIALRPNLAPAHRNLAQLYVDLNYLDLAAKEFRTYLDLIREAGPPREITAEQFRQQLARSEGELTAITSAQKEQEQSFTAEASGTRVLDRAILAKKKGLAGKARDILLASDVSAFGPQGMALELELLTMTGRVQDVRDWMAPEQEASLGEGNFRWLRIMASAAAGDYATANTELIYLAGNGLDLGSQNPRQILAMTIGKAVLDDRPGERLSFATLGLRINGRLEFSSRVRSLVQTMSQKSDVTVLRGLLDLEVGEIAEAEAAFRLAETFWDERTRSGVDFNGRIIAQDALGWLESARVGKVAVDPVAKTPGTR